jgi:CHAT domain
MDMIMMKKILVLSANPLDTSKLRLDEEFREIRTALKRAKNREQFEIVTESAVRVDDLRLALLEHQPSIVHFCGHGSGNNGLALENNFGQMQLVSTESLARLFKLFERKIECVLLNACYSQTQAKEIHQHIDCVIGMTRAIGDRAAIEFTIGFYDALGAGNSYEDCFEVGCASIDLEGIPESETPKLYARKRLHPNPENIEQTKAVEGKKTQPTYGGGISQQVSGVSLYNGGMIAVQGNSNQSNMNINVGASSNEKQLTQQEVTELLVQIEQLIQSSPELPESTREKSLRYLGAAKEETLSNEPDKQLAAGNLKRMGENLKTTSLLKNIQKILLQLANWLGVTQTFFTF